MQNKWMRTWGRPPYPPIRTRNDQLKMGMAEATHLVYKFVRGSLQFGLREFQPIGRGRENPRLQLRSVHNIKRTRCAGETQLFLVLRSERTFFPRALIKGRLCSFMTHNRISFLRYPQQSVSWSCFSPRVVWPASQCRGVILVMGVVKVQRMQKLCPPTRISS